MLFDSKAIRCHALQNLAELTAISHEWDDLLDRSHCNRAFSSSAWYLAACNLKTEVSPCVIVARRSAGIAAVLPLAWTASSSNLNGVSMLADYNDIVCEPDDLTASSAVLQASLTLGPLNIWRVRADSILMRAAQALGWREPSMRFHREGRYSYISLPDGYGPYLSGRSRNFRRSLGQAKRRVFNQGLWVRELRPDELQPALLPDLFLSLHLDRLGEASVFLPGSPNEQFVRMAFPQLFAQQRLRAFGIMRGGACLGLDIAMVGYDSLCVWNGGYRSEISRCSPGRLFLDAEIQQACSEGLTELDLSRGIQDWKERWANAIRDVGRLEVENEARYAASAP